jgi:alpha-amylase
MPTEMTPGPSPTPGRIPAAAREPALVSPVGLDGALVTGTEFMPWWNDAVFYEVFVRSYYDSNGDGVGDIAGLVQKLDYLNDGHPNTTSDLGVTGLWLMPIFQSPSYHGYDVVDYYRVDDEYGTNDDFKMLVQEAHARGVKVIIDLVLNHTSSQHPWFREAQDPGSAKRDWYVWSAEKPQGVGWHEGASGYYYGYFGSGMPDLNYRNSEVTAAMYDIVRFWLQEMGVDGFRLDAVKYLIEDGSILEHTEETRAWLQAFFDFYKGIQPKAVTVGEVWGFTDDVAKYVGGRMDLAFEFYLANAVLESAGGMHKGNVQRAQELVLQSYPLGQYATFLANHDQNRARSRLVSDEQAKVAATLQLAFSGVPFVYYGEEIGMMGVKPDEDIRRPMQWTPDGGFTSGSPWRPYSADHLERNVATQDALAGSLLNHYRSLIRLRNTHEALRIGNQLLVESGQNAVYAALRFTEEEVVMVLVNLSSREVSDYSLSLVRGPLRGPLRPALLLGEGEFYGPAVTERGGFEGYRPVDVLAPYSSTMIQLLP